MEIVPSAKAQGSDSPSTDSAITLPAFENDPYEHLDYLGHGAYGYVDKVRFKQNSVSAIPSRVSDSSKVYARKMVRISSGRDREYLQRSVLNEFKILNRLDHRHIVKVSHLYQWRNCISIIMNQVADSSLSEYLQNTDEMPSGREREDRQSLMLSWPGCLVQAIDYLHEMRIKHKDLKPANILIMDGQVLIADFGISKDLIDTETTASLGATGDVGTLMYCAPEVLAENQRRGRAADMYALGCVFLEIATVILSPNGGLQRWSLHRENGGSRLYSRSGPQILQWISYLMSLLDFQKRTRAPDLPANIYYSMLPPLWSFLMLDPNPKTRITARQLFAIIQLINTAAVNWSSLIHCVRCKSLLGSPNNNLRLHSIFIPIENITPTHEPDQVLKIEVAPDWEAAKKLWLKSHMWW